MPDTQPIGIGSDLRVGKADNVGGRKGDMEIGQFRVTFSTQETCNHFHHR